MKTKPLLFPLILPAILAAGAASLPAATREWELHKTADGLHPSPGEQQMLWLMNRARSNPPAEGVFLANTGDAEVNYYLSALQVNVNLMQQEFAAIAPKPPAAFDRRLYEASRQHSLELIRTNSQNHSGQVERIRASGFAFTFTNVNVYSYSDSALFAHAGLNIDWGGNANTGGMQPGRGHRVAIMSNQPSFLSNVGLALVPETNPATQVGPFVFSGAYCSAAANSPDHFNQFLVGTVWTDRNNNNFYDQGEGHANVRVQPDVGTWHAVTGVAGGWSIPVTVTGTYNLSFSGPDLPAPFSRQVTAGNVSVLVDTKTQPPFTSTIGLTPDGRSIRLTWSGGAPPWQIQRLTDPRKGWENAGPPTRETSATLPVTGTRSFYRVLSGQ